MLLSALSVLVVAQSSSEIPEGLMNNPVYFHNNPNRSRRNGVVDVNGLCHAVRICNIWAVSHWKSQCYLSISKFVCVTFLPAETPAESALCTHTFAAVAQNCVHQRTVPALPWSVDLAPLERLADLIFSFN